MAWTTPKTWASGYVVLAADLNTHLRDNLNVTAPAVMTTAGDIIYASGANTPARLAKSTTSTQYLANTGSSNVPAWNEVALATGVSGTLPVGNGGTGATTFTANGILVGNGTSAVAVTATMATKGHLMAGDGSGAPSMLSVGTNDYVLTADSGEATGIKWAAAAPVPDISVRVIDASVQSCANNTSTVIAFDTETYDTDTMHDNSTNNSRLTCKTAGKYLIGGTIAMDANTTGRRQTSILLNNLTQIVATEWDTNQNSQTNLLTVIAYELDVDDYVELRVYQSSGGALNTVQNSPYEPVFWMFKVG